MMAPATHASHPVNSAQRFTISRADLAAAERQLARLPEKIAAGCPPPEVTIADRMPADRTSGWLVRAVPCSLTGIPDLLIGDGAGEDRVREVLQRLESLVEVFGKGLGELEFAPP